MSTHAFPPDYCTASIMAYLVSMSESTFRSNVRAGILPESVQVGGKVLWNRHDVYAAIEMLNNPSQDVGNFSSDDIMGAARGETKTTQRQTA